MICHPLLPPSLYGEGSLPSTSSLKIKVPAASLSKYKSAQYWQSFAAKIVAMD